MRKENELKISQSQGSFYPLCNELPISQVSSLKSIIFRLYVAFDEINKKN